MPTFVFSYRTPSYDRSVNPDALGAWVSWFESLGESVSERGNPVFESGEVGNCGAGTHLGGYSFVTADDLEGALALAKGCPTVAAGGGVEVGTVTYLSDMG